MTVEAIASTWSPGQEQAIKAVRNWLREGAGAQPWFYLAGYAGTGKSTLAMALAADVSKTCFAAFTGKAALVMRSKGCSGATTIHSLIYTLEDENDGAPTFILNKDSDVKDAGLVVIDECSMVGQDLGRDLLSFGTPVLVLGDPAQLPPVKGAGFFTERTPDFMLTEVHRQARDNPIIRMSMEIRAGRRLEIGHYGASSVIPRSAIDPEEVMGCDQVLVGLNRTRHAWNRRMRALKGFSGVFPEQGERLVCLRNSRPKGLLNGGIWTVDKVLGQSLEAAKMILAPDDAGGHRKHAEVSVRREFFEGREGDLEFLERRQSDEFTFGYVLTVHKSQGSQWGGTFLFDESAAFREDRARWLYTGLTRAADRVIVAVPG